MASRNTALPPELTGRAFSTREAVSGGLSPHRLRHGDLVRPLRGVRVRHEDDGLKARLEAYALHRPRDFAFSHITAAILYGIPLPSGLSSDIHVSVPYPGRAPTIGGFAGHKLSRWETREVGGFPVTTPEQTWLDLAAMLYPTSLVIAGDFLISRRDPLTDRAALRSAISASSGRRGIARARLALEAVRAGSESPGETRLRLALVEGGLPEPLLNYEIVNANGDFVARADLAYPGHRVALEYEGDIHRVDQQVWRRDLRRREEVEDLGWRMVRVTADDIHTSAPLLARVRRLLRSHVAMR